MKRIEITYEVFWDEQPGLSPDERGWVARRREERDGVYYSEDDEPLNTEDYNNVAGAKAEAARYWGVKEHKITAVEFWNDNER